jgi:hypothetical protein
MSGNARSQVFSVDVGPDDVKAYIQLLHEYYDPAAADAGMLLENRWATSSTLGGAVTIQSTWSCDSDEAWNPARARLLTDPRWRTYCERCFNFIKSGTRRMAYAEQLHTVFPAVRHVK